MPVKNKQKNVTIFFRISENQRERWQDLADWLGISLSEFCREAAVEYEKYCRKQGYLLGLGKDNVSPTRGQ